MTRAELLAAGHLAEWRLRRLFAGELTGEEQSSARAHAEQCPPCRAKLRSIEEEQRQFEEEMPYPRFAAGVARAAHRMAPTEPSRPRSPARLAAAGAAVALIAASLMVMVGDVSLWRHGPSGNRLKGTGAPLAQAVVGGPGQTAQRIASLDPATPEALAPGERVRLGYRSARPYLAVFSVDERGELTPLYPEAGPSLPASPSSREMIYLPGSIDFTGAGLERLFLVLTDHPVEAERIRTLAWEAFQRAGGDLTGLDHLDLEGEQLHWTFIKATP